MSSCKICKKNNHTDKDCYSRKRSGKTDREEVSKITFLCDNNSNAGWILDSGASSHMTNNENILQKSQPIQTKVGIASHDGYMTATKIGTVDLGNCELNNVLYIPNLKISLMSVSALTEKGGKVIFHRDTVTISKNKNVVLEGRKNLTGLYMIKGTIKETALNVKEEVKARLWHKRLGHVGIDNMKKLLKLSEGIDMKQENVGKCRTILKIVKRAHRPSK
ncbi:Copia protein [Ooceraea biroi]|uniref:Copia protein n=1 Tax=Ooceraea biroi TaxID=2015173 RepID=A0A026WYD2_OOCBI|nr:Copia protein [Ooceraea biroi]